MASPTTPSSPHQFAGALERSLWILRQAKARGASWLASADIAKTLRDDHGLTLHWRTIEASLRAGKSLVARRKRSGRFEFAIMAPGEALLSAPVADAMIVDPAKALQATVTLHELLSKLRGTVRICDPYTDFSTLQHLDACNSATTVQLLSDNITDSGRLRALGAAGATQKPRIELRKVVGHRLHDRYIIDDNGMLLLGTSLNGFGKKQCFVIKLGQDLRATMLSFFTSAWPAAKPWP